ncbi:hypothetical protein ACVWU4_000960 [Campylobacter coli]
MMESMFKDKFELYDPEREFKHVDTSKFTTYVINVFTIARNVVNAVQTNDKDAVLNHNETKYVILEELSTLKDIYEKNNLKLILWYPDYTEVIKNMTNGKENKDLITYSKLHMYINVLKSIKDQLKQFCLLTKHKLPYEQLKDDKILLYTHIAADLLNKLKITLIESHTGNVKGKEDWYTRYHKLGKADMSMFPFTETLLYYLGDYTISPITSIVIRKALVVLAIHSDWTHRTTDEKVRYDIRNYLQVGKELLSNIKHIY